MQKGTYSLILLLENDQYIEIGKIGNYLFKKGYYVYNGSALGGLGRVRYHLKKNKNKRWHIDYLLECSKILEIIISKDTKNHEHDISKILASMKDAEIPVVDFGSSDCKEECPSHLIYFKKVPGISNAYERLGLEYNLFKEADFKNI
ncbi:MAG: GIY-YIG nuclease family protein [Candidatus Methanofastidiosa archaeon]|nr:GIY-YIG nuclease family protein [Candidatus Methanofastidiosa archaeon]